MSKVYGVVYMRDRAGMSKGKVLVDPASNDRAEETEGK